jgi:hypothetical protein
MGRAGGTTGDCDDDAGIVAAIDRLSGHVRERIGESLKTIRTGEPLDQVTTSSLEALRLYSEGSRLNDQGSPDKAIPLLEQAIALDSGFAMAWRKLAVALGNTRASQERQILATTKAYQHRDRLPEVERQFTIAYYYDNVEIDPAKVEAAYRRILAMRPENYGATNNLALLLGRMGRAAEAESVAAPMARSATTVGNMNMQLLNAQLAQGHTADVRRTLETMARLDSTAPVYLRGRAMALGAWGSTTALSGPGWMWGSSSAIRAIRVWRRKALPRWPRPRADWPRPSGRLSSTSALVNGVDSRAPRWMGRRVLPCSTRCSVGTRLRPFASSARLSSSIRSTPSRRSIARAMRSPWFTPLRGQPAEARQFLREYEATVPEGVRRGNWGWYRATGWVALAENRPADAVAAFVRGRTAPSCPDCGAWEEGIAFERANQPDSAVAAYHVRLARGPAGSP